MKENKTLKLYAHCDAGHSWLAVKKDLLNSLGIAEKISRCSYQKGKTAYLEEDCDAMLFIDAAKKAGYEITFKESHRDYSPVRRYDCYTCEVSAS